MNVIRKFYEVLLSKSKIIIQKLAEQLVSLAVERQVMICTAESCTGGMISQAITSIPGSSKIFEMAIIAYANLIKVNLLGVSEHDLVSYGAVSSQVAEAMARGVMEVRFKMPYIPQNLNREKVDREEQTSKYKTSDFEHISYLAIAVTGIAGPSGGSIEKPVGLVYSAAMLRHFRPDVLNYDKFYTWKNIFTGDRENIREQTVIEALARAIEILTSIDII